MASSLRCVEYIMEHKAGTRTLLSGFFQRSGGREAQEKCRALGLRWDAGEEEQNG